MPQKTRLLEQPLLCQPCRRITLCSWTCTFRCLGIRYGAQSRSSFSYAYTNTTLLFQLKGPTIATLDTPPNHHLFNAISNNQLGQLSPLLKRRQRGNSTGSATAPVINFNVPAEVIHLFHPPAAPATPVAAVAITPATPIQPLVPPAFPMVSDTLIPADRAPGPMLSLDDFCKTYFLTDGVQTKLDDNRYSGSHTFQYAE